MLRLDKHPTDRLSNGDYWISRGRSANLGLFLYQKEWDTPILLSDQIVLLEKLKARLYLYLYLFDSVRLAQGERVRLGVKLADNFPAYIGLVPGGSPPPDYNFVAITEMR